MLNSKELFRSLLPPRVCVSQAYLVVVYLYDATLFLFAFKMSSTNVQMAIFAL